MGRLVRIPRVSANAELEMSGLEGVLPTGGDQYAAYGQQAIVGDNYLERIAKYVPAEVLAFFVFINAILGQAVKTGGEAAVMAGYPVMIVAQAALAVGIVLTPLFVWYVREEGDAWVTNAFVSTLAFPVWAYVLGAVAFAEYHDGNLAAILLATFSVISGLIAPRRRQPKRRNRLEVATPQVQTTRERDRPQFDLIEPAA
jgi:hypothetical protein